MRLSGLCSTVLGGPAQPAPADFATLGDAAEALPRVAGELCRQTADAYASAMRLQVGAGMEAQGIGGRSWLACCNLKQRAVASPAHLLLHVHTSVPSALCLASPCSAVYDGRGRAAVDR